MKKKTTWVREKNGIRSRYSLGVVHRTVEKPESGVSMDYTPLRQGPQFVCFISTQKSVWSNLIGHVTKGFQTCVKSSVLRGPEPVVRICSRDNHCQTVSVLRRPRIGLIPQLRQSPASSTPQTVCSFVSYILILMYTYVYHVYSVHVHVCLSEHYRCSLMMDRRDVGLHLPVTRTRRHVELPNHESIRAHSRPRHVTECRAPHSVTCPQHTPDQRMT
jgi:hypothetical protein